MSGRFREGRLTSHFVLAFCLRTDNITQCKHSVIYELQATSICTCYQHSVLSRYKQYCVPKNLDLPTGCGKRTVNIALC